MARTRDAGVCQAASHGDGDKDLSTKSDAPAGFSGDEARYHQSTVAAAPVNIDQVARVRNVEYSGGSSELLNIFGHELVMRAVKSRIRSVFISA
jgi:hypothetical protein